MLEELREKMGRVTHIQGVRVSPLVELGDGALISWALTMCNYLMNPDFTVISRRDFGEKFDALLGPKLAGLADCTDEERRAQIRVLVAAASEVGTYDADEPLRAATPEGSTPS